MTRRAGILLLALLAAVAVAAPILAPHDSTAQFPGHPSSPPTPWRLAPTGSLGYSPQRLISRLERRFDVDRDVVIPLQWFSQGRLLAEPEGTMSPWLPLGADSAGRDVFSRLLYGARTSLLIGALATAASLVIGALAGALAGYRGGLLDELVMRGSEFLLLLPVMYVALALRTALPLTLDPDAVMALLIGVLVLLGWPWVARGTRAIVASERRREYAEAARASGASNARVLFRHVLPAAGGYLATQGALLLPAFILAEATLSFVGLGLPDSRPSWGTMLQEASDVVLLAEAPWVLAPAAAIVLVTLAAHLAAGPAAGAAGVPRWVAPGWFDRPTTGR